MSMSMEIVIGIVTGLLMLVTSTMLSMILHEVRHLRTETSSRMSDLKGEINVVRDMYVEALLDIKKRERDACDHKE